MRRGWQPAGEPKKKNLACIVNGHYLCDDDCERKSTKCHISLDHAHCIQCKAPMIWMGNEI